MFNKLLIPIAIGVCPLFWESVEITQKHFLVKAIGYLISPTFIGYPHCIPQPQWGRGVFRDEKEKIMGLNIAFNNNGYIANATDVGYGCYRLGITPKNLVL